MTDRVTEPDLVKRLRDFKNEPLPDDMQHWIDAALSLMEKAADEIERLRRSAVNAG